MDLVDRLRRSGGCLRRSALLRSERDAWELRSLVAAGVVERRGHGLYALPGTSDVVVAARRVRGSVTCVSALRAAGLPLLGTDDPAHVCLPRGRASPRASLLPAGTVLHWDAGVRADAALIAPVPLALSHAIRCLPRRDAVAAIDAALNRRLLPDMVDLAALRPRAGKVPFDQVLRLVDGRSESFPETCMRLGVRAAGLHVEPQAFVEGVGRVDLLVEGVLIAEVDGYRYHADRQAFGEDRRRDRTAQLLGHPCLRFTYDDAVWGTARSVHEVRLAVTAFMRRRQLGA